VNRRLDRSERRGLWRGPQGPRSSTSNARRYLLDRFAARFVSLSGILIIGAILAILFVIVAVVWPLSRGARAQEQAGVGLPAGLEPLAVVVDEYRLKAVLAAAGGLYAVPLRGTLPAAPAPSLAPPAPATVTSALAVAGDTFFLGLSDGRVLPVATVFEVFEARTESGQRQVEATLTAGEPLEVGPAGAPAPLFTAASTPEGSVVAAASARGLSIVRVKETTALVGGTTREVSRQELPAPLPGDVTALAMDSRGEDVFAGLATGEVVRISLRDGSAPSVEETVPLSSRSGAPITTIGLLHGDRTVVIGDGAGGVSSWQVVQGEHTLAHLRLIHRFASHAAAITVFSPSRRDKGFATGDARGGLKLHYSTTGRTLLDLPGPSPVRGLVIAPKADGLVVASAHGLRHLTLHNPHPEATWGSLFGKVWYEGYERPAYVWQSTGGTDDFEAKLSLVPLIFGTLKGTLYSLLVAVPLALLGALYTAQFMHPGLKAIVKPTVEIMAALPSVVLGFIAGLWLAPQVERIVPGIAAMVVVLPLFILAAAFGWSHIPPRLRGRLRPGTEFFLAIPLVLLAFAASLKLGKALEGAFLQGDYRTWLLSTLGVTFDQRNSLVVGLAMGFAVIPIIFTVAEDSIASVPPGLTAGSLALGATRWQTAIRTVLPTASPGIFSAVMIGFGRAVGETMIVLMATGNTPVMNMSIWSGFRALSANIAVELPEAPENGTLFRVLFLAALLLYLVTFLVNTAAELVRLRLRKQYRVFE